MTNTHARNTDPGTSHYAADHLTDKTTMCRRILLAFRDSYPWPVTPEQATSRAGYEPEDGAWRRVSDLLLAGFLTDTGDTVLSARTGRPHRLLRITQEGHDWLAANLPMPHKTGRTSQRIRYEAQLAALRDQRDRARSIAVTLEQENADLLDRLAKHEAGVR